MTKSAQYADDFRIIYSLSSYLNANLTKWNAPLL